MTNEFPNDDRFRVTVLAATPNPQRLVWQAMHQDYAEGFVGDEVPPAEDKAGSIVVRHLLAGGRGHYGPLEHPQISFNCGYFPHSVMQQARTHRVGVSFDVQSGRYTGQRICQAVDGELDLEDVFYLRPVGTYRDRRGKQYAYTEDMRSDDRLQLLIAAERYADRIRSGWAEEHARGLIPFDFRQHFVVSFNLRSALHFLDLRCKKDAQWEIQTLSWMLFEELLNWAPNIVEWYEQNRLGNARLAP